MSTENSKIQLDLTNCDREPIHIPGSIQPHGVLLALLELDLTIVQLSANTLEHFNIAPDDLLDKNLDTLLSGKYIDQLRTYLANYDLEKNPLFLFTAPVNGQSQLYDWIAHKIDGLLVLELEKNTGQAASNPYLQLKSVLSALAATQTLDEYCDTTARQVQQITGFDRVMVYKFDEDGHGQVIAEAKRDELSPFLGLHYPASDIPRQARALYVLNWLRIIPDIFYEPVVVVPTDNMLTGKPLDQSFSVLRSVSPIHVQYLKNMGIGASMSISIIKDNELWGLVACHHQTAHFLPFAVRSACELLAQTISLQLADKIDSEGYEYRSNMNEVLNKLVAYMVGQPVYYQGLFNYQPNLGDYIEAGGATFYSRENGDQPAGQPVLLSTGNVPTQPQIEALIGWLEENDRLDQGVFYSTRLPQIYPAALEYKQIASGVLAIYLSRLQPQYILWFRPEVVQTVNWAGNPNKPVEWHEGQAVLTPRHSFDTWKEQLSNHSNRWKKEEIDAALELRRSMISIVLRRMDELNRLGVLLEEQKSQSARTLVETGLKEPLQEIQTYLDFLLREYGARLSQLDPQGQAAPLANLQRINQRMKILLDSLRNTSNPDQP